MFNIGILCSIQATMFLADTLCYHTHRKDNLSTISDRILQQRQNLYQALKANGTPGSWDHILNQTGMFSFTGLTRKYDIIIMMRALTCMLYAAMQVEYLTKKHHIYLLKNGRINMCGLNSSNIEYVADAIKDAVTTHPEK